MLIRLFAVLLCLFSFAFSGCERGNTAKKEYGCSFWKYKLNTEWLEGAKLYKTESGEFTVYYHGDFLQQQTENGYQIRISGEIALHEYSKDGNRLYFCHNLVYNDNSGDFTCSGKITILNIVESSLENWIESNK